ncbi:MAG: histidinol-phosphate transaminase [Verrucomicrobiota bacterium]|nr:histidinol-phosphate transaminase [Verrucomicrobiota bacterium]
MSDLQIVPNPQLKDIIVYEPGKPIEDVAREWGLDPASIIKLASNENPLGPSPKAREAMRQSIEKCHLYPDGGGYYLRQAIASKFSLDLGNIILGNGSNEIIEFLGHAFLKPGDEVVMARHAFVVYKLMATLFGASTVEVDDPGFVHDLPAMLKAVTPKTKLFFIANPNNPTGTIVSEASLINVIESIPDHVIVVIDEAYYEFLDNPPRTIDLVKKYPNILLMRTFSKIQGLAGLRIGYGIAPSPLVSILQKTRQPFNVNAIAQAGALAALADNEHIARTKKITDEGRVYLEKSFSELNLPWTKSAANFILVKVGGEGAGKRIFTELQKRGIIVRDMTSYRLPEYIRVTIGTHAQNSQFIEELRKVL